jgi:autotransporter-associated beta strand protein
VIDFSQAVLSSTLLGWDTSQIYTTGVVSVDRANYFWTGTDSSAWGNGSGTDLGNFTATNSAGSAPQNNNLFSFSNVFLSMAGAANATNQTLGGNGFTINSLSFIAGGNTLSGGGATLTLSAASAFQDQTTRTYAAGIGLVMQAGAASATLDTDIIIALGANQIWEIDSNPANPLTLNGSITDNNNNVSGVNQGTAFSLTKTGAGTLIFNDSGANSYVGGTNVAAGLLFLMPGAALGETTGYGTLTMSGGTLDLNGTTQSVNGLSFFIRRDHGQRRGRIAHGEHRQFQCDQQRPQHQCDPQLHCGHHPARPGRHPLGQCGRRRECQHREPRGRGSHHARRGHRGAERDQQLLRRHPDQRRHRQGDRHRHPR